MIREATPKDCVNLSALSLQVWLHTYAVQGLRDQISRYALSTFSEKHFQDLLRSESQEVWVCVQNEHLLGYIVVDLESRFNGTNNGYEVVTLYVSQHFKGQGIGRRLLARMKSLHGVPCWLSVWENNHGAIEFYKKAGFEIVGELDFELEGELHRNHVLSYPGP